MTVQRHRVRGWFVPHVRPWGNCAVCVRRWTPFVPPEAVLTLRQRTRHTVAEAFQVRGPARWRRLWAYAKLLAVGGAVRLLQILLFNPVALRFWVWLLKGRVEFFGASHVIGEMAIAVDYYLKRKLHLKSRVVSVHLINKPRVANAYLAKVQARAFGSPRTLFVMNRFLCQVLQPLEHQLFFTGVHQAYTPHPPDYHDFTERHNLHLERHIPAADRQRARTIMEPFGLPRDATFVCVHVRDVAFHAPVTRADGNNTIRSADVMTYVPAIEYLVRQGFWVVRLGEAGVKPLPPMDRVIDYARSPAKSAFLDVLLIAECEFFVGSSSGLSHLATIFNKFMLMANTLPLESVGWGSRTFWLPKLIYSRREQRYLTYPELLASDTRRFRRATSYVIYPEPAARGIGAFHRAQSYVARQLDVHDTPAKDILDGTQELHRWYLGDPGYSEEDVRAQRAFTDLFPPHYIGYGTRSRICASFIRNHPELMPQAPAELAAPAPQAP